MSIAPSTLGVSGLTTLALIEQDADIFRRDISEELGVNYDELAQDAQTIMMFHMLMGHKLEQKKNYTPIWYEQDRFAPAPLISAGAVRSNVDGTTNASGNYVTMTISSSQVNGVAGKYYSYGQERNLVYLEGTQLSTKYIVQRKIAPLGDNTGHKLVLGLPNGSGESMAAMLIKFAASAKVIVYSSAHNALSTPAKGYNMQYSKYTGAFQELAQGWEVTGPADVQQMVFGIKTADGKESRYITNRQEYLAAFILMKHKQYAMLFGERNDYDFVDANNTEATTTTDGLLQVANSSNVLLGSLAALRSGNINDGYDQLDILAEFARGNNSFKQQMLLAGGLVKGAWQRLFSTFTTAKFAECAAESTVSFGGITTPIVKLTKDAFDYEGFQFMFLNASAFNDPYNGDDMRKYAVMLPLGTTRVYDETSKVGVNKASLVEGYFVDSSGQSTRMVSNPRSGGVFKYGGENPREDHKRINTNSTRCEFSFEFHNQSQIALVKYS